MPRSDQPYEIPCCLQYWRIILTAILFPCLSPCGTPIQKRSFAIVSSGTRIKIEERCGSLSLPTQAAVIFLHGSGGPQSENLPYLYEVQDLAEQGYCAYIPHYLDATGGSADHPKKRYPTWVQVVEDTSKYITASKHIPISRIALVGYSLGAAIALASAATNPHFGAIVEFSGSLPDEYVPILTTSPPILIIHGQDDAFIGVDNAKQLARLCVLTKQVCRIQLYPGEGHFFSTAALVKSKREVEQFLHEHIQ